MTFSRRVAVTCLILACLGTASSGAADLYACAILPFTERGVGTRGMGTQVGDLLFAELAASERLILVDRVDLARTLEEHELNLSGMVNAQEAVRVGQLTGAKLLITGSIMEVGNTTYLVAKIIGTETTRVLAATAKGKAGEDIDELVVTLATAIDEKVAGRGNELVAKPQRREDLVAALNESLGDGKRAILFIRIGERHIGQATIDPAAETAITQLCRETGFTVVDPDSGSQNEADIMVTGEGFSEFAMRRGNLISVKARLEVKAVDRDTDEVIASDSQAAVMVDLTEQLAGKAALQRAAEQIAARLLPKLLQD